MVSGSKSRTLQIAIGVLSGLGTLCVLYASSWTVLILGWSAFLVAIGCSVIRRQKTPKLSSESLLELGVPIHQAFWIPKNAMLILGIFVVLLGFGGLVSSIWGEMKPNGIPGAMFLIGAGLTCFAIPDGKRAVLSLAYGLWALAGAVLIINGVFLSDSNLSLTKNVSVGVGLLAIGMIASYKFMFLKAIVHPEGFVVDRAIVPWDAIATWKLVDASPNGSTLHLNYKQAPSRMITRVSADRTERLTSILTANLGPASI